MAIKSKDLSDFKEKHGIKFDFGKILIGMSQVILSFINTFMYRV